jgi:hypothetical protein
MLGHFVGDLVVRAPTIYAQSAFRPRQPMDLHRHPYSNAFIYWFIYHLPRLNSRGGERGISVCK